MDRRRFLLTAGLAAGGGALLPGLLGASGPRRLAAYPAPWGWAVGQPVSLKLYAGSEQEGLDAAQAAFAELRRVEAHLTRFDAASDLSALNAVAGRSPLRVGDDLRTVLRFADGIRRATGGAFDPAVEPVMRAWGFHAARNGAPDREELEAARDAVREARLRWDGDRVSLDGRGAALDLGGIGVGYGLDRAGAVLRARGIAAALLDVSGDILAIGAPPGRSGWQVGIAVPSAATPPAIRTLRLADAALATSANTMSLVRWNGRAFGHVTDPHTARPSHHVRQATVIAPSGMHADAWSTACLVAPVVLPAGCDAVIV